MTLQSLASGGVLLRDGEGPGLGAGAGEQEVKDAEERAQPCAPTSPLTSCERARAQHAAPLRSRRITLILTFPRHGKGTLQSVGSGGALLRYGDQPRLGAGAGEQEAAEHEGGGDELAEVEVLADAEAG